MCTKFSEEHTASCFLYRLGGNNFKPSQALTHLLAQLCTLDLVLALRRASAINLGSDPSILRLSYSPSAVNIHSRKSLFYSQIKTWHWQKCLRLFHYCHQGTQRSTGFVNRNSGSLPLFTGWAPNRVPTLRMEFNFLARFLLFILILLPNDRTPPQRKPFLSLLHKALARASDSRVSPEALCRYRQGQQSSCLDSKHFGDSLYYHINYCVNLSQYSKLFLILHRRFRGHAVA